MKGIEAQREAEAQFQIMHKDFLLSFNLPDFCNTVAAWMRTEGVQRVNLTADDEGDYLVLMEQAFVELYNRGALVPATVFSASGQKDLDNLLRLYKVTPASEKPAVAVIDPLDEIVKDFNELPSEVLKAKIFGSKEYAALFEKACSNGRIKSYVTFHE